MIKHTIEVSARPASLSLRHSQLCISSGVGDETVQKSYSCEDVGVLILQHPAISVSSAVMNELLNHGAVIIICDTKHHPSGMLLPVLSHTELVPRMKTQLKVSTPRMKQAWKNVVCAKIEAQKKNLITFDSPTAAVTRLDYLASHVKSGDSENYEAQAAKVYWQALFPDRYAVEDKRLPEGESLFNACLNYGYAIIRAATARAIVSSGMQPALGIFHHSRNNAFCLADDLMEPLRPLVDYEVRLMLNDEKYASLEKLERAHRERLLHILQRQVTYGRFTGPLMVALARYTNGFYHYLAKEKEVWESPIDTL